MMTNILLHEKSSARNPYVRFDGETVALVKLQHVLLYKFVMLLLVLIMANWPSYGDLRSDGIVGYSQFEIKKGVTRLNQSFLDPDGNFYCLERLADIAIQDDEVFYYAGTNVLFSAKAKQVDGGVHFVSSKTGLVVDSYLLPAVMPNSSLKLLYKRTQEVTSPLTLEGDVPDLLISTSAERDEKGSSPHSQWSLKNLDMNAFVECIGTKLRELVERQLGDEGGIYSPLSQDERMLSIKNFDEWIGRLNHFQVGQFYVRNEAGYRLIEFNFKTRMFIDLELGTKFEFDSVDRFECVVREGTSRTVPENKRMPSQIVDEMNGLLNRKFFDEKSLFYVIFKDGTSVLVYIAEGEREKNFVRDARNGDQVFCGGGNVKMLSSYPDPRVRDASTRATYGRSHYLSDEELMDLNRKLLPVPFFKGLYDFICKWLYEVLCVSALGSVISGWIVYRICRPIKVSAINKFSSTPSSRRSRRARRR